MLPFNSSLLGYHRTFQSIKRSILRYLVALYHQHKT